MDLYLICLHYRFGQRVMKTYLFCPLNICTMHCTKSRDKQQTAVHHKNHSVFYVRVTLHQSDAFWCWKVKNVPPLPLWLGWNPNTALLWASAPWINFSPLQVCNNCISRWWWGRGGKMAKAIVLTSSASLASTSVPGELHEIYLLSWQR